jgi:hypothetical protein
MRMPNETLPARGFSAEYFPQFRGIGQHHEPIALPFRRHAKIQMRPHAP